MSLLICVSLNIALSLLIALNMSLLLIALNSSPPGNGNVNILARHEINAPKYRRDKSMSCERDKRYKRNIVYIYICLS